MRRLVLLIFLFAGDTVLFAAGSPDLLVAIPGSYFLTLGSCNPNMTSDIDR